MSGLKNIAATDCNGNDTAMQMPRKDEGFGLSKENRREEEWVGGYKGGRVKNGGKEEEMERDDARYGRKNEGTEDRGMEIVRRLESARGTLLMMEGKRG